MVKLIMKLLKDYHSIPPSLKGAACAIGNFDGLHPGHLRVIHKAGELAQAEKRPWGVVTFEPHPRRFFAPTLAPFQLTSLEDKVELLEERGVDVLFALPFDARLSFMSASTFITDVLVEGLAVCHIVSGEDFGFGKARAGSVAHLNACPHFRAHQLGSVMTETHQRLSSSLIRAAIQAGDVQHAAHLMGRKYRVTGTVVRGNAQGHALGFPTANLDLGVYQRPAHGVYAARATIADSPALPGIVNFGLRPTMGGTQEVFEIHLFDFDDDLYDQTIQVSLYHHIRDEKKFNSIDALKARIAEDCRLVRGLLS